MILSESNKLVILGQFHMLAIVSCIRWSTCIMCIIYFSQKQCGKWNILFNVGPFEWTKNGGCGRQKSKMPKISVNCDRSKLRESVTKEWHGNCSPNSRSFNLTFHTHSEMSVGGIWEIPLIPPQTALLLFSLKGKLLCLKAYFNFEHLRWNEKKLTFLIWLCKQ